ncbi:hypothetical protein SPRG_00560 [Saprolegnia parasitica CBS 223.65]|uniref:Uncharacterized protein n=1 Tax=Saprolegnia parasitica (strain CBS 223.65) TaxID=695850 RepID=A0A067D661_SAPPC|nr:hypothetical protein SPRG_00560 [Saprolegnia parasitica CBS 223.65]KDO34497.1 hypothetical protein SPRG_00560 [Saprolegnia parasitica CBS 223.65]|eukprot:XP_012194176.1 hypothetical protein SPRG_00560 [Saprolegnia parasitica CBS 223.65]
MLVALAYAGLLQAHSLRPPPCAADVKLCNDGMWMYRDIKNNCTFAACADEPGGQVPLEHKPSQAPVT